MKNKEKFALLLDKYNDLFLSHKEPQQSLTVTSGWTESIDWTGCISHHRKCGAAVTNNP